MARTTAALIKGIVEVDSEEFPDASLLPFIEAANVLVTEKCASTTPAYDEARLTMIETWLAGHFYVVRARLIGSEGVAGISTSYNFSAGMYLAGSPQGQAALALDTNGGLARLNSQTVAGTLGSKAQASYLGYASCKAKSSIGMTCL